MKQAISLYIFYFFVVAIALASNSDAKRGCANYGHSCYGGHGKRSNDKELFSRDNTPADGRILEAPYIPSDIRSLDTLQRYRLVKRMMQWIENQRMAERLNDAESMSNEIYKDSPVN